MELSAVVKMDDGSINIKKSKISFTSEEISFFQSSAKVAKEQPHNKNHMLELLKVGEPSSNSDPLLLH